MVGQVLRVILCISVSLMVCTNLFCMESPQLEAGNSWEAQRGMREHASDSVGEKRQSRETQKGLAAYAKVQSATSLKEYMKTGDQNQLRRSAVLVRAAHSSPALLRDLQQSSPKSGAEPTSPPLCREKH